MLYTIQANSASDSLPTPNWSCAGTVMISSSSTTTSAPPPLPVQNTTSQNSSGVALQAASDARVIASVARNTSEVPSFPSQTTQNTLSHFDTISSVVTPAVTSVSWSAIASVSCSTANTAVSSTGLPAGLNSNRQSADNSSVLHTSMGNILGTLADMTYSSGSGDQAIPQNHGGNSIQSQHSNNYNGNNTINNNHLHSINLLNSK